jgi:hypothetical protein
VPTDYATIYGNKKTGRLVMKIVKMLIIQVCLILSLYFNSCASFCLLSHTNISKNGAKEGVWIEADTAQNGFNIISISVYKHGIKNGKHISYYTNGIVEKKGHYKKGIRNGKWYFYYPDGSGPNILKYSPTDTTVVRIINPRW